MRKALLALVATLALALCVTAVPAQAEVGWTGYRMKPVKVAHKMHCTDPRGGNGPVRIEYGEIRCDLGHHVVNVVTFRSAKQQRQWLSSLSGVTGAQFVAYARGIIVVGKNSGASSAKAAAEILDCDVRVA